VSYTSEGYPSELNLENLRALAHLAKWRDQSKCVGKRKLFFAPNSERPQARIRREAKASSLCKCCPALNDCRQFARENHEYGFWGGENEEQRHLAGYKVIAPIGIRAKVIRPPHENNQYHY
jgi:WhiB family redox-sensing transcriptional regulator